MGPEPLTYVDSGSMGEQGGSAASHGMGDGISRPTPEQPQFGLLVVDPEEQPCEMNLLSALVLVDSVIES